MKTLYKKFIENQSKRNKTQASLLVYGPCSNAGDVLIHKAFNKLFENSIETKYHHIRKDKLDKISNNVIIGPGEVLSGSYNPDKTPDELVIRHLTEEKISQWVENKTRIFAFGSGTNTPFNATAGQKPFSIKIEQVISKLFAEADGVYLRGSSDIVRLQGMCQTKNIGKIKFQPCPSIFLDKLYDIKPKVEDKVAINFPFMKSITKENYKTHPINRFIKYIKSVGLKPVFVPNHTMDLNKFVLEIFDSVDLSSDLLDLISKTDTENYEEVQESMQMEWENYENLASRFNGYRFAFGNRLHSFLPFMAFNTPSVFLAANPIRMPLPLDYFSNNAFLAKTPYTGKDIDKTVDGMIDRLDFFVKHESSLRQNIQTDRDSLFAKTKLNMNDMISKMN